MAMFDRKPKDHDIAGQLAGLREGFERLADAVFEMREGRGGAAKRSWLSFGRKEEVQAKSRRNPLVVMGAALALGLALGFATRAKRRS